MQQSKFSLAVTATDATSGEKVVDSNVLVKFTHFMGCLKITACNVGLHLPGIGGVE